MPRSTTKSSPVISVPIRYVRDMVDAARQRGFFEAQVLVDTGISPDLLADSKARVSHKAFSRLYATLVEYLLNEGAGLSACRIPAGSVETMVRSCATAGSFAESVTVMGTCLGAVLPEFIVRTCIRPTELSITLTERNPLPARQQTTYEVVLLTTYASLAWLFGQRLRVTSIDFPGPAPRHLYELRTLVAGRVLFKQKSAALRFSPECEALHMVRSPAEIPEFLRRAPASLIEALVRRPRIAVRVRQVLHDSLPGALSLDDVARQLAMSPRTLHRKLLLEGESFQQTKDELRRDLAIHALERSNAPLKKIAESLGFADQASFQRAFVSWTGQTPGTCRRAARGPES